MGSMKSWQYLQGDTKKREDVQSKKITSEDHHHYCYRAHQKGLYKNHSLDFSSWGRGVRLWTKNSIMGEAQSEANI